MLLARRRGAARRTRLIPAFHPAASSRGRRHRARARDAECGRGKGETRAQEKAATAAGCRRSLHREFFLLKNFDKFGSPTPIAWRYRGDECTSRRKRAFRARDGEFGCQTRSRRRRARPNGRLDAASSPRVSGAGAVTVNVTFREVLD